jgi:rod shape-determining protein MreD
MDVADASLLGQHALAYVLAAYGGSALSRRILWFPLGQQALQVFPLLLLVQLVQFSVRMLVGADSPGMGYFIGPCFGHAAVAAADIRPLAAAASTGRP